MRSLLLVLGFFLAFSSSAQEIIINKYAAVLDYQLCSNGLLVDNPADFSPGDTVLVIQMKGAVIDSSNSPSFGDVIAYNGAGNYELNTIKDISGNVLELHYQLKRQYNIPNGRVQVVRVPSFTDYVVNQPHTALAWDGTKGGVFMMLVSGTLTLNDKIDVTGKGFRGGQINNGTVVTCNLSDYYYPAPTNDGGEKGEGIAEVSTDRIRGRGKLANGGGGGNNTNTGGGGGSNAGTGGEGGRQWVGCDTNLATGGIGGLMLSYTPAANKLFLGGGGGAGHENNFDTDPGGNGGGIVIISAGTIAGTDSIIANGADCVDQNSFPPNQGGDGQSGGGGGGAVLINATSFAGTTPISAHGGNGGNNYLTAHHGPGAGGSGGVILFANATLPSGSLDIAGGLNGTLVPLADAHHAEPGQPGQVLNNFPFVLPVDTFATLLIAGFTDSSLGCATRQFIDTSYSYYPIVFWHWDFGDGNTSNTQHPVHTFASGGSYSVMLAIEDSLGCRDTVTRLIDVSILDYQVSDSVVGCKQLQLRAVNNGQKSAMIFEWDFGDGSTGTGNPIVHTYAAPGGFAIRLILTDSSGCKDTVNHGVFVDDLFADFTVSDDTICQGEQVTFTNNSSANAVFYAWDFGDGTVDSSIAPVRYFFNQGAYTVRLIVGNISGCLDTSYQTITVDSITSVNFYLSDSTLCEGNLIQFIALYDTVTTRSIEWDLGNGVKGLNTDVMSQAYDTAGTFMISIQATYRSCPQSSVIQLLTIHPYPKLDLGNDTSMCPGGPAWVLTDYINMANPMASWRWNNGDTSWMTTVRHPGIYTSTVTLNGCETTDSVEVFKDCYLDVPNSFTPNGDGINDYFLPRQDLSRGVTSYRMSIYNRWGQLIFETRSIDGRGWDGRFNGQEQPQGVYVYLIEVGFANNTGEQYTGNLTLLR